MSVQVRKVSRFDQVRFRGPGSLKITQGDVESLTVHAPEYLIGDIISEVKDNVLYLGYVSPRVHRLKVHREIISYQLSMKDFRHVTLTGSGKVLVPDLDNDVIGVSVTGSGQVSMENLTADRFKVSITGSGRVLVAGDVEMQSVNIRGSGRYRAERLVCDYADINVTGSGSADVSVSEDLHVAIRGSGNVSYAGNPENVTRQISGSGKLTRRRRHQKREIGEDHGRH